MKVAICGFYGFGNLGDEAILQSIMDELGRENEYIICTSLPYNHWNDYYNILKHKGYRIVEIRCHDDLRTDFDCYILGGGELNFGYAWRQCLSVFANGVKCMNMGVGYNRRWYYSKKLHRLYYEFLKNFDRITVRDMHSGNLLKEIGLDEKVITTFDMGILLKEEKFKDEKNEKLVTNGEKVVVFPRYEDYGTGTNQTQLDWLIRDIYGSGISGRDVLIVACSPKNFEGHSIDLELCQYLNEKISGSQILNISPFEPGKAKYLIGRSRMVYSGGRYHPIVFAIGCGVPFKMSPTSFAYAKNGGIMDMFQQYGRNGLIELAKKNKELFLEMVRGQTNISGKLCGKLCNIGGPIGEILIPENEPCDIWYNWEGDVRNFMLKRIEEKQKEKGICFLDIGANLGYFSLWAATKTKMVVSIEPNPVLYELLNHNCVGSGKFSNIKTYNIAISDRTGNKEFYYRVDAAGDGRLYNPTECGDGNEWLSRNVPVETLSSLQDKLGMNGIEGGIVDLIKIDCEGSEYEILKDLDFFKRKENKDCEVILELHKTQIESRKLDYEGFMDYLLSYFEMSRLTGERMGEEQMKERIRDGDVLGNKYVVLKFLK